MSIFTTIADFTSGYSPVESLLFDRFFVRMAAPLHDFAMEHIAPLVRPSMRILDVGCGGGQFAVRLAERFSDVSVVGVDLSPEQIGRARRRGASLGDRVSFVEGTALDLPFDTGDFDLVYSLGSLKHWPDRARGLRECARVLKPGERLWLIEGDRGCRHEDVQRFIGMWNIPARLRPLASTFYRVVVVGQSLDLDDARVMLAEVGELEGSIVRAEGLPIWVLEGRVS